MKKLKIIYLAALLLLSSALSAQYQSIFGKHQTSWYMYSWIMTPESITCDPDSAWLVYGQDTTFQNKTFKPLMDQYSFQQNPILRGYVSEDTTSGKVWFRSDWSGDTIIHQIMDMSLTVNDSFYVGFGIIGNRMVAVDSIYYLNSRKIIELNYKEGLMGNGGFEFVKYTMIEGVGVNIRGVDFYQEKSILKYHWKDRSLNYNAILDSIFYCDTLTSSLTEISQRETTFDLFPNPVNQSASIELGNLKAVKIELIDISGRLIKTFPKNTKKLDFSDVTNGLYFVRVSTANQDQFNKKIVVQK